MNASEILSTNAVLCAMARDLQKINDHTGNAAALTLCDLQADLWSMALRLNAEVLR